MLRWTWKSFLTEPWHLLASACAIGSAFALVLFFEAVFAGESRQIVAYIQHSEADVWVMQEGVSNMHMATSFVSDWKADVTARVAGVNKVTPILYLNTVMRAGEGNWFSFIVGLDGHDPRAGPWAVADGEALPRQGEALVPETLARLAKLEIGDFISIAGHRLVISGLTEGTFSMANSVTFVTMDDLSEIMSTFGSMSYFLVDGSPGVDARDLARRIESEVEKVSAVPHDAFVDNEREVAMQMGVEIIWLMTVIGGALAVLLTGFAVYASTARREREFAVLKALGFRNRSVYASVMVQASMLAMLGVSLAVGLVIAVTPMTARYAPQVTLQVTPDAVMRIVIAAFVVALLACLVPARRVVRVDPLSAFRT